MFFLLFFFHWLTCPSQYLHHADLASGAILHPEVSICAVEVYPGNPQIPGTNMKPEGLDPSKRGDAFWKQTCSDSK